MTGCWVTTLPIIARTTKHFHSSDSSSNYTINLYHSVITCYGPCVDAESRHELSIEQHGCSESAERARFYKLVSCNGFVSTTRGPAALEGIGKGFRRSESFTSQVSAIGHRPCQGKVLRSQPPGSLCRTGTDRGFKGPKYPNSTV